MSLISVPVSVLHRPQNSRPTEDTVKYRKIQLPQKQRQRMNQVTLKRRP